MSTRAESDNMPQPGQSRATIVGLGLIGGSIGLALRQSGWFVSGGDQDEEAVARAIDLGVIDVEGIDTESDIVFIATPVSTIEGIARRVLKVTECPVTDVGSVKAPISEAMSDEPRFVPGHPMAGNEFSKLDGADPTLFKDATWILTPTDSTSESAHARVHQIILKDLGAKIVGMEPERHDSLLAAVSHVPHFTAAAIMQTATEEAGPHVTTMMKVAAGGFRDMTRIASGDPEMWLDVSVQNREAISDVMGKLIDSLSRIRTIIDHGDMQVLKQVLLEAQLSRRNLPIRVTSKYAEVTVPVEDRTGVLKEVTNLATELDVNIFDLQIRHTAEGDKGTLVLLVEDGSADRFFGGLRARNFRPHMRTLGPSAK